VPDFLSSSKQQVKGEMGSKGGGSTNHKVKKRLHIGRELGLGGRSDTTEGMLWGSSTEIKGERCLGPLIKNRRVRRQ